MKACEPHTGQRVPDRPGVAVTTRDMCYVLGVAYVTDADVGGVSGRYGETVVHRKRRDVPVMDDDTNACF